MCRAHRVIVAATIVSWAGAVVLMFVPLIATGNMRAVAMLAAVNIGAIAACLTMLAVLPVLLRDMFDSRVSDYIAAYLAGLARGQGVDPTEPKRLHAVN